ncbi:hypothetical protein [Megamonas hypermegale]|uniref:hypothetical protein n=1 Tax=Megamonas hypermegale TaxID=158847 RepID=UPI0026E9CA61|nr:hypothetical protein [Megamonas hypermegale]
MNEDKWKQTIAKRRQARYRENRLGCLFIVVVLIAALIGGAYYIYHEHTHSPEYTLEKLQEAFADRDVEKIHRYIDFKAVIPPNYKVLTNDIFANDTIYTEKERDVYQTFYAIIEPIITDGVIQSVDKYIQTGNWQRYNYNSMLKGRQLGIDYAELINRSLLFNIAFKEVKSIENVDNTHAVAVLAVADKYTQTDFDLHITMTKNDSDDWIVTRVDNYQEYLNNISKLYREDINSYLAATKADLDRSNARFGQLKSEFTVLAEGLKNNPSDSQKALLKSYIENKIIPAYQDWYNYLQNNHIPLGARHLHELRLESASYSIQAWKKYADGIYKNDYKELGEAERIHNKAMETEQKVTDTINNMPALFMPTVD